MASIEDDLRRQLSDAVDTATHPQAVPVNVFETSVRVNVRDRHMSRV